MGNFCLLVGSYPQPTITNYSLLTQGYFVLDTNHPELKFFGF
ncbi:hypothetical protein GXM_03111 [Nostoc sphaeroides CCNUC1]|uniref:Uncharacterized protein n=1 Tax=Nostoc sphaeroides CCNUC1 TaxID=2653204 RepID=A0A5P8VZ12_9NOSO|nr:hypothetical protein GXM_03111 [Nostoc sphaeroides CCNUC1]